MGTALAIVNSHEDYSREKIDLIKRTICNGATDDELQLFLYTAKRTGLDPLARQIHMVKRWNSAAGREVAAIQTGIDGYRLIADRTGKLAGISDVEYDDDTADHPCKATVTVRKIVEGAVREFTASARWSEYVQTRKDKESGAQVPNGMWAKMPYLMLGKCAEALALRKAFPADLSGVYTSEEMGQADNPEPQPQPQGRPPVSQPQRASESGGSAKPEVVQVSGVIESAKLGKEGSVWFSIDKKIVAVKADLARESMAVGGKLSVKAVKRSSEKAEYYWTIEVLESVAPNGGPPQIEGSAPPAASQERQAEFVQELDSAMSEPSAESAVRLDEMFDKGEVQKGSDLPAGKNTIGPKRAQRLYAMCGQNKAVNGGLNEKILKQILARMTPPLEHLGDLPMDLYPEFEKMAEGKSDWKRHLED